MKIVSNYRLQYAQSFVSSTIVFFMSLFFSFVIALLYSKIIGWILFGTAVTYLFYWNLRKDGQLFIDIQSEKKQFEVLGKIKLKEEIKAIHIGWSYAYHNPIQSLQAQNSHFLIPMNKKDKRTIQNTFQKIIILELENGQKIALLKELLPWQETGDLKYIGHLADKMIFDHQFYIDSFPSKISLEQKNLSVLV